ncbi:MAG: DNA mismatch repair protein MutS [Candidatus Gracilibacteria bacterium]|nr:DNA mismatch repair protein MutS [Candidatus Gracilibacteria bacterium]
MTPMLKQYQQIKKDHADCLLLFRLGDFYELFFEDAKLASKLLGITLTARYKGTDKETPMCGVPHHSVTAYIAKLVKAGHKVAICDQVTVPDGNGIVDRAVTRIITPGSLLEDNLLEDKTNNYIISLSKDSSCFVIAYADLSTGELVVSSTKDLRSLKNEIVRLSPSEAILEQNFFDDRELNEALDPVAALVKFPYENSKDARQTLLEHFQVKNLNGFGLEDKKLEIQTVATLLNYLAETQKGSLENMRSLQKVNLSDYMELDAESIRNLELFYNSHGEQNGTLISVLDHCYSNLGSRLLRKLLLAPLLDSTQIKNRLEAVSELVRQNEVRQDLISELKNIQDLERLISKISLGRCNPRDMLGLRDSLLLIPKLKDKLKNTRAAELKNILEKLDPLPNLVKLLKETISEDASGNLQTSGYIKEGVKKELDELRQISSSGKENLAQIQKREVERTGITSLKVKFNQVFGYYIEISKANLASVPEDYTRKQTLVNAERFITPELKDYEEKILGAEEKILKLELEIFEKTRQAVSRHTESIQQTALAVAKLDVFCTFAQNALDFNYCQPEFTEKQEILIKDGRHPVIEKLQAAGQFVSNDTEIKKEARLILITGPNMAGKSTYLRQVALICLMAQIGSFVPASKATLPVLDRIFTRVGASDFLSAGQSTFMVEMQETANILNNASSRSLVILDEIGRGTSTYDGLSIAWAVSEYLHNQTRCLTLFASHYHELIELIEDLPDAKNYHVSAGEKEGKITFFYKLQLGGVDKSYGIEVSSLAGIPQKVTERAKEVLEQLESSELKEDSSGKIKRKELPQIPLFTMTEESKILQDELKKLDLDHMTPIEAWQKLRDLKNKL